VLIRSVAQVALAIIMAVLCGGAADAPPSANWVDVSTPIIQKLTADGKKLDWPGQSAGVVCDATDGDVFIVLPGQGLWKSTDRGATFDRVDGGAIGGRCETSFALNMDPAGKRLACFMLDGKCAVTTDSGKTWQPMADLGRNWDYAAVDWSGDSVLNIFGERHEVGGEAYLSNDGGKSWKLLFKDPTFDRFGGLGIFDAKTLVRTWPRKGIERSTDAGANWKLVSEFQPNGRVAKVVKGVAYWLNDDGMLISRDKGLTWEKVGTNCPGTIGPMFDPKNDQHMTVVGAKGIFETKDGGKSWELIATLPPHSDIPKPGGWFTNVAWDPANDIFYVSRMGFPAWKWERKRN